MAEKICKRCGRSFETSGNQHNVAYCSRECRKAAEYDNLKASYERKRLQRQEQKQEAEAQKPKGVRRTKQKYPSIGEISVLARKAGMTYGKYVAQNKL